jgi:hypothetical protein
MLRLTPLLLILPACGGVIDSPTPDVCPGLVVSPDVLEWRDVLLDSAEPLRLTVSLPCDEVPDVRVRDLRIDGDPVFAIVRTPDSVPAGGSVPVNVRYEPTDYGPHAASLVLDTDDGEVRVSLVGRPDPDQDGDGVDAIAAGGEDCDDTDPTRGAPTDEVTNLVDDDCDGFVDEHAVRAGDVLIAELMLRPQEARAELGQWIEVRNTSDRDIDLLNWELDGPAGTLRVSGSTVVRTGDVAVLGVEPDSAVNGGIDIDGVLTGAGSPLAQRDWSLTLSVDGMVVADLERQLWPDPFGASISLDPIVDDAFRATLVEYWCPAFTRLPSGDVGTPGTTNDRCPDVDHDGDGRTVVQGDCDDDDPTVAPGKIELWDGKDNNCSGIVDLMRAADIDKGHVDGVTGTRMGGEGEVGMGDLDGDGQVEFYLGHTATADYTVYVIHEGDLRGGSALVTDTAFHAWKHDEGGTLGGAARNLGDVDGDGDDDLVLVTRGSSASSDLAWVADTLPAAARIPAGRADMQAVITSGREAGYAYRVNGAVIDLDLDGDGTDDPVIVDSNYEAEGDYYANGRVYVLDMDGVSGEVTAPDQAEAVWTGAPKAGLGRRPSGGDVDDDGYDDLFLRDDDPNYVLESLSLHVVYGGSTLPADGAIGSAADLTITNLTPRGYSRLGAVNGSLLADVDDDGDTDLVVSDPFDERVYVFRNAARLSGTLDAQADFDVEVVGRLQFGQDLTTGDLDGDGRAELIIGAPETTASSWGAVYVFGPDLFIKDGKILTGQANAILNGASSADRFGQAIFAADLGGEPTDDLVVSASHHDLYGWGRLWLFERDAP